MTLAVAINPKGFLTSKTELYIFDEHTNCSVTVQKITVIEFGHICQRVHKSNRDVM